LHPPSPVRGSMVTAAAWGARLAAHKDPDLKRSVWQLANAALLFAGAWALMYASLGVGYWLTLLLALPAAFLLVRLVLLRPARRPCSASARCSTSLCGTVSRPSCHAPGRASGAAFSGPTSGSPGSWS